MKWNTDHSLKERIASNSKVAGVLHDELIACGQPPPGLQNTSHLISHAMVKNESIIEASEHPKHPVSAPHDRLPLEVLREIFLFLITGCRIVQTVIPPSLSSLSWTVNRTWRYLSRSMFELWGTATLHLSRNCTSPDMVQRALITLPDICKIDVHVVDAVGIAKAALVPYLARIHELHWQLDDSQLVDLWSILSPNALSRIVTLDLTCSLRSRKAVDNGESIEGETGQFFGKAARLQFLKLDVPEGVLPMILSMDIPWGHLTSLCISCHSEEDVDVLAKILCGCTALNRLNLQFYVKSSCQGYNPLILEKIKFFTLLGFFPSFLLLSPCVWNELNELCLEQISLPISSLCCILSQCRSIGRLSCCISSGGPPTSELSTTLPHLHTLSITIQQAHIFSLLQTPALEKIVITALDHLELLPISNLITRSGCVVDSFTMSYAKWQSNPAHMRELLTSLACVISFSMHGIAVHDDLLDDVASGTLLPNVSSLLVSTPTFETYMGMVQRRLQWEQGSGQVRIGVIEGSAPERVDEMATRRLKEVGRQYGICCQFHEDAVDVFESAEGLYI
ncbi:hypothetical protein H2248_008641 [Termitomyces sp. 'cryptogamus']|nr:hypothetical protein H2248_008641 [Termitomyces sp. 'cryptogamus']